MQTFLPYADFARCAAVLDNPRLGKQRVETLQVMQVLLGLRWDNTAGVIHPFTPKGWRNHPVVLMWQRYEAGLAAYQDAVCDEWTARGFVDTCKAKTRGCSRRRSAAGTSRRRRRCGWATRHCTAPTSRT